VNGGAGKDRDAQRRDDGGDRKRGWREDDGGSSGGGVDRPAKQPERESGYGGYGERNPNWPQKPADCRCGAGDYGTYGGRNPNWPRKPPAYEGGGGAPVEVQVPEQPAPAVTESPTAPATGSEGS
jgi:hypothetical protein